MQESPQVVPQGDVQPEHPMPPEGMKPHRGGAILALGIIGLVICFITGIIAWVMGSNDLKEMDAGIRDPEGRSLTKAGMICGIVATCLAVLWIFWVVFVIGLTSVLGAAGL